MPRYSTLCKAFLIFFILTSGLLPFVSYATDFDAMVVPSLMDSDMDGWYRIPMNSGPAIHKATQVTQGQIFSLLIFFRGYTVDKGSKVHIRYDVQVYDPKGKPTEDKGSDLLAYQGEIGNNRDALLLNQQFLKILFTEKYPVGTYNIKVVAFDKIANTSFTKETPIELVSFSPGKKFSSEKELGEWLMGYYGNPTPVKAIHGVLQFVQLDREWVNKRIGTLAFFRRVFTDNPFLLENISRNANAYTIDEKKKLILMAVLSESNSQAQLIAAGNKELNDFLVSAKKLKIPDTDAEITSADQLDVLWSEFLATGKYHPVKKIVSALALSKYKGTLDKIKSGEIKDRTREIEKAAYLDATYQSAVWSLISNCKQMPLVFKYCIFVYENESLPEDIKNQLGAILSVVQKKLQNDKKTGKDQAGR